MVEAVFNRDLDAAYGGALGAGRAVAATLPTLLHGFRFRAVGFAAGLAGGAAGDVETRLNCAVLAAGT